MEHRTLAKLALHGENRPVSQDTFDTACREALTALRRQWDGTIFHPPRQSSAARDLERQLIGIGRFQYRTSGGDVWNIELRSGNRIMTGDDGMLEKHWAVVDSGNARAIEIYSDAKALARLHPCEDGVWRGQTLATAPLDVALAVDGEAPLWVSDPEPAAVQKAAELVDQILDPSLIGAGFEPAVADQLGAALAWAAKANKHVLQTWQATRDRSDRPLSDPWRERLCALADQISKTDEVRQANRTSGPGKVNSLDPDSYERQL